MYSAALSCKLQTFFRFFKFFSICYKVFTISADIKSVTKMQPLLIKGCIFNKYFLNFNDYTNS